MTSFRPKNIALAAAFGLTVASSSAFAFPEFQVEESAVPGAAANLLTADRISFDYNAEINQTVGGGSLAGNDDPFTEYGFFNKAAFANGGAAVPSQLNGFGAGGYGIYGVFNLTGEADLDAAGTGILATINTATLTLWLDPDQDTTLGIAGGAVTVGGNGDDGVLANYTLVVGQAHLFGGLANGDFDTILNISLTPLGESYFVSPDPFFPLEAFGGNTETIVGASLTNDFIAQVTGGGIELFQNAVPEPGTVALVGLGLLGMGVGKKRRAKKA